MPEHAGSIGSKADMGNAKVASSINIPVWLHATESFYKKLNRVAKKCGMHRYEALSRGLDALLREHQIQMSPLNKTIKSPRAIGGVSAHHGPSVPEILGHRQRGRETAARTGSAHARWKGKSSAKPAAEL